MASLLQPLVAFPTVEGLKLHYFLSAPFFGNRLLPLSLFKFCLETFPFNLTVKNNTYSLAPNLNAGRTEELKQMIQFVNKSMETVVNIASS